MLLLLVVVVMLVMEVDSFQLRHFEQGKFRVAYDRHVSRVDMIAQRLGSRHTVLRNARQLVKQFALLC